MLPSGVVSAPSALMFGLSSIVQSIARGCCTADWTIGEGLVEFGDGWVQEDG